MHQSTKLIKIPQIAAAATAAAAAAATAAAAAAATAAATVTAAAAVIAAPKRKTYVPQWPQPRHKRILPKCKR